MPVAWFADSRSVPAGLWNAFGAAPHAVDAERGAIRGRATSRAFAALSLVTIALVVVSGCRHGDRDEETLDALVEFARSPADQTWSALPLTDEVRLGLGERLLERHSRRALRDPRAWKVEAELFRASLGPFSALEVLAEYKLPLEYREGSYVRCVSPPAPPPRAVGSLRRLSIQPRRWQSCLQWFAVDVFITDDGDVAAVTLDYFEP
jgi:hypothetical protein